MSDLTDAELALRLARALGWEIGENCLANGCRHRHQNCTFTRPVVRIPGIACLQFAEFICESGDGMLAVLDAMRASRFSVRYLFTKGLHEILSQSAIAELNDPTARIGPVAVPLYMTPRAVAEAALLALEAHQ